MVQEYIKNNKTRLCKFTNSTFIKNIQLKKYNGVAFHPSAFAMF